MKYSLIIFIIGNTSINFVCQDNWMLYPTADSSINKSTFTDSLKHDLDYSLNNGEVSIFKDARIDSIQKGLSEDPTISGWTVQLLVSQQKEEINSTKIKFLKAFPDQQLFDEYKTPNTYLYVGRFYDKISAYHFKNEINYLFKNTRVLKKSIEAPVLPGRKNTEKEVEKNSNPSIEKSE